MRRAILAVLVTAVGLVLLLSFKPHELTAVTSPPSALSRDTGPQPAAGEPPAGGRQHEDDDGQTGIAHLSQNDTPPPANDTWTGSGAGARPGSRTVAGDVADTRWGPLQVEIILTGNKMTDIRVLQAPDRNHRDLAINSRALPTLNDEALAAQSAQIDTVSGATYTSEGYIRSLQSALDRAGL